MSENKLTLVLETFVPKVPPVFQTFFRTFFRTLFDKKFQERLGLFFLCLFFLLLPILVEEQERPSLLVLLAGIFICASFRYLELFSLLWKARQKFLEEFNSIDLSVLLVFLSSLLSTLGSVFFRESLYGGLLKYFIYFYFYFSLRVLLTSRLKSLLLIFALLTGLFYVNLEALWQVFFGAQSLATWEDPQVSQKINRVYSFLLNPNLLGAYLLVTWVFLLYFAKFALLKKKYLGLFFLLILILFNLILIFRTGSRGAWLGLFFQLIFYSLFFFRFLQISRRIKALVFFGGFLAVLCLFSQAAFYQRLLSLFSSYNHSSNSFRFYVWDSCQKMFFDNFFFGIGTGSEAFYQAYSLYMHANYSSLGAYSLILELAVELGFFGLLSFIFLFMSLTLKLLRSFFSRKKQQVLAKTSLELWFQVSLMLALSGIFVQGFFDVVVFRPQVLFIVLFLFFLISKIKEKTKDPKTQK